MYIATSSSIDHELQEFFKFRVPGCKFMPKYKSGQWDGFIRLFNKFTKELYLGLFPYVIRFAKERDYEIEVDDVILEREYLSLVDAEKFYKKLKLPVVARDYQIEALSKSVTSKRRLILSPTASGKSLIIYALARYYNKKTLLIVPTVSLVSQMYNDFDEYSSKDKSFNVEKKCHKIFEGQKKTSDKQIFISTWQSLYRLPKKYFQQFDVVIGDEAHLMTADSLKTILSNLSNAKYRFGTTGTIEESKTHKLVLEGLFGNLYQATTTKELMDRKELANLNIKCIVLKYSEETRNQNKKLKYQEEIKFLVENKNRNEFLANLVVKMESNSLILFRLINHGKLLAQLIEKKVDKRRKVFLVYGGTDKETREEVRKITEKEKNAIIVASVGVFSTGVNIKNLVNIIFASPSKSRIRTLQSIGRGLRIGRKDYANLYDIVDDMSYKSRKNFALIHFVERMKIYNSEKFQYKIFKLQLREHSNGNPNTKAIKRR